MHELILAGCRSVPMAHYLKALGVLRIVAEQADGGARGCWRGDTFVLQSTLSLEELERFFLDAYRPAAIVAPWNGGSGFNPKDNQEALRALEASTGPRLADLREAITAASSARARMGITDKTEGGDTKERLIRVCRAVLPDTALPWLDAAVVLTSGEVKYPPLLGTGGNNGRFDFTNNYMQRLLDLFDASTDMPRPDARIWLVGALFGGPIEGLLGKKSIGQFFPGAVGGANASPGFDAEALINPWDYVLMLEGALVFAGAATRRLGSTEDDALAFPFTVRSIGAGYGSGSQRGDDDAKGEIWLPLWEQPATARDVLGVFTEGRVQVRRRAAANGLDFVRAASTLGVDRGLSSFERYGFLLRNGQNPFATPLGRFDVHRNPAIELLDDARLDAWLRGFRRAASDEKAPASASRALYALENALIALGRHAGDRTRLQAALVAFGACERVLARSAKWARKKGLAPVPPLDPRWLEAADDASAEFRLAVTLAGLWSPEAGWLRENLSPVKEAGGRWEWSKADDPDVVWGEGDLLTRMIAVLGRRIMAEQARSEKQPPGGRQLPARRTLAEPDHVLAFLAGRTDDDRLRELIEALVLIDWRAFDPGRPPWSPPRGGRRGPVEAPPYLYAAAKLCHCPQALWRPGSTTPVDVPVVAEIHRRLAAADAVHVDRASDLALRRLRGSGLPPFPVKAPVTRTAARRIAAALLIDVPPAWLLDAVIRPDDQALPEGARP